MIYDSNSIQPLSQTQRLVLRYFETKDKEPFLLYRNDKENTRFQGWTLPFSRADLEEFYTNNQDRDIYTTGQWLQIAVELQKSGELIGDLAFCLIDGCVEVGITIRREFQQHGYATEAMNALMKLLRDKIELHQFIAKIDPENTSSIKLFEKLGFSLYAHNIKSYWDQNVEEWRDELVYSLEVSEI